MQARRHQNRQGNRESVAFFNCVQNYRVCRRWRTAKFGSRLPGTAAALRKRILTARHDGCKVNPGNHLRRRDNRCAAFRTVPQFGQIAVRRDSSVHNNAGPFRRNSGEDAYSAACKADESNAQFGAADPRCRVRGVPVTIPELTLEPINIPAHVRAWFCPCAGSKTLSSISVFDQNRFRPCVRIIRTHCSRLCC